MRNCSISGGLYALADIETRFDASIRLASSGLNATSELSLVVIETLDAFVANPMRINGSDGKRKYAGFAETELAKIEVKAARMQRPLKNIKINDSPKYRLRSSRMCFSLSFL